MTLVTTTFPTLHALRKEHRFVTLVLLEIHRLQEHVPDESHQQHALWMHRKSLLDQALETVSPKVQRMHSMCYVFLYATMILLCISLCSLWFFSYASRYPFTPDHFEAVENTTDSWCFSQPCLSNCSVFNVYMRSFDTVSVDDECVTQCSQQCTSTAFLQCRQDCNTVWNMFYYVQSHTASDGAERKLQGVIFASVFGSLTVLSFVLMLGVEICNPENYPITIQYVPHD